MTLFLCQLWPYLAGALIGWLLAGWLAKRLKHGEPPVEKIVEKQVERVVDNPKHLSLISKLESENSQIAGLQSQVASLESARSKTREVTVDKVVKSEKIVEVDNPEHLKRISELEAEIRALKSNASTAPASSGNTNTYGVASTSTTAATPAASTPSSVSTPVTKPSSSQGSTVDLDAAKKAGFRVKQKNGQDDFTIVEGVGPKINDLIHAADIHYYAALATTSVDDIQKILDDAGPRYKLAKPGTWPDQAKMAAENRWDALKKWQDELDGGQ
ncbi:hypothetical protein [uncultured Cocleimonas sp.]|uniref:hypothetical protein n=1 Tax=uncultured Cocleimonas sp. TaxID=1051587 RepID=UPI0026308C22|nr:hypothetical protein [uncultured Cocleimonas sp.]